MSVTSRLSTRALASVPGTGKTVNRAADTNQSRRPFPFIVDKEIQFKALGSSVIAFLIVPGNVSLMVIAFIASEID